jgi:hypothetical protein
MDDDNYIIEYTVIGNSVKVTAFDPVSLRDVTVIGSIHTPKKQLAKLAVRKLIYMIKKDSK